jgi:hypothetical protein
MYADNKIPIFDKFTCQKMMHSRRHCEFLLNQCQSCTAALIYCKRTLADPFYTNTNLNPFDIRKTCIHNDNADSCYPAIKGIVH